jgi:replication-associated recombination protein RarA
MKSAPTTKGGHDMFESLSALQKCIRRGQEEQALYWASELDISGYSKHLWNRLRIIASEDVGLAMPGAASIVRALYENWQDAPDNKLWVVHATLMLVRAPKSRIVDHACCIFYNEGRPTFDMPDFALDKHTHRGRKMGRGIDNFFDVGGVLANETLPDPYKERAREACKRGPLPTNKAAVQPDSEAYPKFPGLDGEA